jgi:gamma-glutamylputrescine oxidase
VIPGYAAEQPTLIASAGEADARRLWDISVEAIELLRSTIEKHRIECDWRAGQLQAGIKPRHADALRGWHEELQASYGYRSTRYLNPTEMQWLLGTRRYVAGLLDSNAGHLHPLNYTLGLARAAVQAGASFHEHSPVVGWTAGEPSVVRTAEGSVRAKFVVFCGNALLGAVAPPLSERVMPVSTYIIATEPLGEARALTLIRDNVGVTDTNFILDYFRRSADHRLLFGGRVSYSGRDPFNTAQVTRRRMVQVFPQLADAKVEYAWGGLLDITMNRAPDFGRLAPNVYYLQGFSGHGVALAGMAGKLVAEAVAGQAERFDLFGKIKHRNFPGGATLRMPALVLAMLWYRMRDLL